MPTASRNFLSCAKPASAMRYTATSMRFLALYLLSLSTLLNSISRPGRMKAYSPQRRMTIATASTMNVPEIANTVSPNTMTMGTVTSSTMTPRRVRDEPGEEQLRDHHQRLHDGIEAREHLRALGDLVELLLDELQLFEVQEGVDRRHADDEQHDADEIGIAYHEHEAREGIASQRAIAIRLRGATALLPAQIRCHCASSTRCRTTAIANIACAQVQHAGIANARHEQAGQQRPDQRARRAARGDQAEQPLGLLAAEDLEHEAPEHRYQQQVHDADADVEHARQRRVLRIVFEHHRGDDESHGHESVDGRQQHCAPHVRDQPSVERHDEDGENRREDPEVLRRLASEDGADGFAHGPHGEVATEHAEQQHEADDHDARFGAAHGQPRLLLVHNFPWVRAMLVRRRGILEVRSVAGHDAKVGKIDFQAGTGDRGRCTMLAQFFGESLPMKALHHARGTPADGPRSCHTSATGPPDRHARKVRPACVSARGSARAGHECALRAHGRRAVARAFPAPGSRR